MLLLAGLGVGAFMLFSNKSDAQSKAPGTDLPQGGNNDVPDAPKILAVNSSSTESPTPTGIVSDEEGMEATGSQQSGSSQNAGSRTITASSGDDDDEPSSSGSGVVNPVVNVGFDVFRQAQEANEIPPLVSTKLTPKEKAIIDSGKLTAALALKRPDLYKAAYIKRYGGQTQAGKRKALIAASLAIDAAVNAAQAANTGGLVKAVKYPAKPEYTFVQTAGGMAAQVAVSQMAALQKAGVKVSPAAQKVSTQVKAAKGSKGRHPVKSAAHPKKHVAGKPASKHKAAHPASQKHPIKKRH